MIYYCNVTRIFCFDFPDWCVRKPVTGAHFLDLALGPAE